MLRDVLNQHELLFDRTLVTWKTIPLDIELNPGAKQYHSKPYSVPRSQEDFLPKGVQRLCQIGFSKKNEYFRVRSSHFHSTKKEQNRTEQFLSNFRKRNEKVCRKPFPIPKIQDMLLNLKWYTYTSYLNLNTILSRRVVTRSQTALYYSTTLG